MFVPRHATRSADIRMYGNSACLAKHYEVVIIEHYTVAQQLLGSYVYISKRIYRLQGFSKRKSHQAQAKIPVTYSNFLFQDRAGHAT